MPRSAFLFKPGVEQPCDELKSIIFVPSQRTKDIVNVKCYQVLTDTIQTRVMKLLATVAILLGVALLTEVGLASIVRSADQRHRQKRSLKNFDDTEELFTIPLTYRSKQARRASDSSEHQSWASLFQSDQAPMDPCQDERGNPRRCIPDFENAAFGRNVTASSTCGSPAARLCQVTPSGPGVTGSSSGIPGVDEELVRTCQECDSSTAATSHPASLLTDVNNPSKPTCWMSEPFNVNSQQERNVSLKLSLGKKFELTYVSLQFCGSGKPDSLAIYKSSDYGVTWQPFQFYSTNCQLIYGRASRSQRHILPEREHEPLCSDPNADTNAQSNTRIAFSTLEGRPSAYEFDQSPLLQDWVTATDIRVDFRRLLDPRQQILPDPPRKKKRRTAVSSSVSTSSVLSSSSSLTGSGTITSDDDRDNELLTDNNNNPASLPEWSNESLSLNAAASPQEALKQQNSYYFYSLAELAIGGRCKCNGHASRCVKRGTSSTSGTSSAVAYTKKDSNGFSIGKNNKNDADRELECECRHNTAGRDCEKCAPFYFDRPWARATASDAKECRRKYLFTSYSICKVYVSYVACVLSR